MSVWSWIVSWPEASRRASAIAAQRRGPMRDGASDAATAGALEETWADEPTLIGWLKSNNHKVIGRRFIVTAFGFFTAAGVMGGLMRHQLATPNSTLLGPDFYNQLFSTHGTTMMFLFAVPMMQGFALYIVPLMIGTRNSAFPRMTACAYWLYVMGGLLLLGAFVCNTGVDAGWFEYVPLAGPQYGIGKRSDFWNMVITFSEATGLMVAADITTVILKMRAPGMSLRRMPLFVWASLMTSVMIIFAMPMVMLAANLVQFDRMLGTHFFNPAEGGDALLWQHMFWFFGHPEVYILVLPAMGVTSDILSTFSRKPIFGYRAMAFSMISIAFLSWVVWGHHMFISGMNPVLGTAFMLSTMVIAVPSAIKTFNWLGTLWGGNIRFTSPMLFALGFVSNFVIGGLSGIYMASTPVDIFIHDTYFIVAHFHYVVAGIIFGMFAALYYWFPKLFGRMMNETLGKIHFALTYIFFNGTFFPMHFLGVAGHMRRIYNPMQYEFLQHMQPWNVFITISAYCLFTSQFIFVFNFFWSLVAGKKAERNPWQANTLEWTTLSPPPHGNFEVIPTVYRGPYEYSSPLVKEDWLPQDRRLGPEAAAAAH